jgi:hypothetical protein
MAESGLEVAYGRVCLCLDGLDAAEGAGAGAGAGAGSSSYGYTWFNHLLTAVSRFVQQQQQQQQGEGGAGARAGSCTLPFIGVALQRRYGRALSLGASAFLAHLLDHWHEGGAEQGGEAAEMETGFKNFVSLGMAKLYQEEVLRIVGKKLARHVRDSIAGVFDEPFQDALLAWADRALGPFVRAMYPPAPASSAAEAGPILASLRQRVLVCLVVTRAEELFDVVADFPDSMPAVKELRDVANATNSLHIVGKLFGRALRKRLLHIGASTQQILDMYVSAIRALRIVDPSDALLTFVTKPVRRYLRQRKDTVRSIVTSLIQSKQSGAAESSELHGELKKGGGSLSLGVASDDDEGGGGGGAASLEEWQPARRHPDISYHALGRGHDIVALLVSIYESTDLFVSEYRSLLSEKLLQSRSYDGDAEIATLEFLKIRYSN